MKKLKLSSLQLNAKDVLTREQLKKIYGGSGDDGSGGTCGGSCGKWEGGASGSWKAGKCVTNTVRLGSGSTTVCECDLVGATSSSCKFS